MSVSNGKVLLSSLFNKLVEIRDQKCSVLMNQHAQIHLQLYVHHLKSEARRGSEQTFAAYNKLRAYVYRVALTLHYLSERDPDASELSENTVIKLKYFISHIYSQKSPVCNRCASNIVHTSFFMCATAATCSAHTQRQTSSACPAFVC